MKSNELEPHFVSYGYSWMETGSIRLERQEEQVSGQACAGRDRLKTQMTSREMSFVKRMSLDYFLSWLIAANNEIRKVFANGLLDPVGTKYAKSKPYF